MEKDAKKVDDDEISIDFSKIKKLFKKDETETKPAESTSSQETEAKPTTVEDKKEATQTETKQAEESKPVEKEQPKTKSDKDNDEINIDFGKIKSMFKSDKKESHSTNSSETADKKDDDEISVDFSKVKNIFKGSSKKTSETDDEISIDFRSIATFAKRHAVLLLLILAIGMSIYLRIQVASLPITDEWAVNSVTNGIKNQIRGQINQQYPNLPDQNKNVLIDQEFARVVAEQGDQLDQQVQATSNAFKERLRDDNGQTYLLAIDPYFWLRYAQNIVDHGYAGDEIRDGREWDNHMFAPIGRAMLPDVFHAYVIAYLFKIFSIFNSSLTVMTVAFFVPVWISALSVIPAFFITRKIAGNVGATIAAMMVAIHPSFLTRTAGGFSDSDAYNVMFPLFITWFFIEALEAKDWKRVSIYSTLAGFFVGLYSSAWGGWWYIFDFLLIATAGYIGYYIIIHRNWIKQGVGKFLKQQTIKNSLTFIAVFFVVSMIATTYFIGFKSFITFAENPIGFAKLKEVGITTIWPNVFTTVAEQNPASLNNVINQVGLGKFYIFLIALMGIVLTLSRRGEDKKWWFIIGTLAWYFIIFLMKVQNLNTFLILISIPIVIRILLALWESDDKIDIKYAILLILWFIATTYASTKGVRFTLLLVPAFAIGFGIALGTVYYYLQKSITKYLKINKTIAIITAALVVFIAAGTIPVPAAMCDGKPFPGTQHWCSGYNTVKHEIPSFTDAWKVSLEKIKNESEPDAIINSWWDFGHWFKNWADRAVTFDGTSQNTPPAHWVGKVLLTDDEDMAVGILRMLDCGSRFGFRAVAQMTQDGEEAIRLMNEIMPLDREGAKQVLENREYNEEDIEKALELTHCEPPENYFITSEDMVGKSGVWAHFGSWDFERALIFNTLKKDEYKDDMEKSVAFLQDRFGYTRERSERLYFEVQNINTNDEANTWIAPWPGYAGESGCRIQPDENILTCNNGFIINLTTKDAYANGPDGIIRPSKVSFMEDDDIFVREYNESVFKLQNGRNLGLAIIKRSSSSYDLVQMDADLTAAMFTRMFYQEGRGLKHFDKFSDEESVFGSRIIVWKVDWEGKSKNQITPPPEVVEEPVVVEEIPNPTENESEDNDSVIVEETLENESNENNSDNGSNSE